MIVRATQEADLSVITDIYADAVLHGTATFDVEPPTREAMARRFAEIRASELPYVSAERGGVVVGYAYAAPFRLRAAYASTVEDSVYVARAARGTGVGRALLGRLIEECEARDLRSMLALVGDAGSEASIRLHVACGFQRAGVLHAVGYKMQRWLDVVLLERALGPGAGAPPTRS